MLQMQLHRFKHHVLHVQYLSNSLMMAHMITAERQTGSMHACTASVAKEDPILQTKSGVGQRRPCVLHAL